MFLAADKGAYQPRFLSLGPYHRGDSATEDMRRADERKPGNLDFALSDKDGERGGPPVEEYMKAVASMEAAARRFYDRDVTMEWGAFCRMLLLDGFQLITLLESYGSADEPPPAAGAGGNNKDGCRPRTCVLSSIGHDLMMLENQIPFFVVEKLYGLRYGQLQDVVAASGRTGRTVAELAWTTIRRMIMNDDVPAASSGPPDKCLHLVHLCHVYLKPSNLKESLPDKCPRDREYGRFRRATEYHEAGVKFRQMYSCKDGGSPQCPLLDVSFSNGVLRMARHRVDEKTNYILRNVLAYEQRYIGTATDGATGYVAAYVVFMSQLLGSPEDVALLSRRGVIEHHLGNDGELCALFRGLAEGLAFDPSSGHYLNAVGVKLRAHYRSRIHRWRAWVVRRYFGNPCLAAAWVFGAMAVLGTILQTAIAILVYVNQGRGPTRNIA